MEKFGVQLALEGIGEARAKWAKAQTQFNSDVEAVMGRLLNEAARNYMSAEQVATAAGMTPTRVRVLMKKHGLNPRDGKTLLAKKAAEHLQENAALLGVEPHEFDLMSPLAYLPMGSELRKFLETAPADLDEVDPLDDEVGNTMAEMEWKRYAADHGYFEDDPVCRPIFLAGFKEGRA